jgi:hypothetical protein
MIFTKDTVFLNLVRGEREHENYGITHTIRKVIVDENLKKKLLLGYRVNCRCCGNVKLKRVISLGFQPLANNLINSQEEKFDTYPLELNYCEVCYNCQLSYVVDPDIMFKEYLYLSSTTETFKNHFKDAAFKYLKKFNLNKEESLIIDIGSNDGIALLPFKALSFKNLLGIDIRALEKTFNDSVDIIVENKRFIEQQVSKNANSKFLYAGEQLRQLVGDYAIMDTTYTMSVTRYVFDFNNYLIDNIQNIQNLQKAKSRLDDTGTIIESILTTDVTTINVELRDQMYKLQNNLATSVFTSLSGLVYNSIFEKFSEMIDEKVSEVKKQVSEIQTIQLSDDTTS